ncbi:lysozyme inhibitor LprI family protein [Phenylobacterium sp. J367]|uniref:lysozyme inhibitor LprI family protein n=1 Tax=Phenylobacterium sp. J367 TaxID=2898435 RepID=UPI002150A13E|nr:lysozyme inhibitor LprI family protein [Phenylobacterium sp. J367]MCR5877190.1 lysozyme inhibitor LprI family protein [Phenylobacterium sp. J367]
MCANPDLRAADRRLKQAYERAIAAGVDPLELDREQAEWRTAQSATAAGRDAMARAYELRIGQLEAHARTGE